MPNEEEEKEFEEIISVVGFLAVVWICGRLCKFVKLSPLIGWIASGLIFGPNGLELIPNKHKEVWRLLGTLGVTLMIAESGTHIHFDKVRKVGVTAVLVAIIGTFLPLLLGFALVYFMGFGSLKAGFAAGCAMAPTSVSVALKLLCEANQLNSLPGQTIVTAAFLDDVFSIILLVILQQFDASDASDDDVNNNNTSPLNRIFAISSKFVFCFLFLSIGVILAMYIFNQIIPKFLHYIPSYDNINYQPRDEMHLIVMIIILISYSYIGDKIGSHLLGAFIAGMSFSQVSRSMYVWRRQMKRLCQWLIKLFFACSVAFTIPTDSLLKIEVFVRGLLIAFISGIFAKMLSGFATRSSYNYVVGFAMVGRGEFAYLVAQKAKEWKLISADLYGIIVWALLIAVIVAPIAFGFVLQKAFKKETKSGIKWFTIRAEAKHHTGVHFEVVDVLHNLKLDILEAKVETDGDTDCSEFIVGVSGDDDLDTDKMYEILHDIREAVGDSNHAQVQLLPIDEELDLDHNHHMHGHDDHNENDHESFIELDENDLLEIKLMSKHSPHIFAKLIEEMESNGIQLIRGHLDNFLNTDSQVIFGKICTDAQACEKNDCRNIKSKLKNVLEINNISGEILCKKIRRDVAVFPHHIKFSDLLQSATNKNNPLLSSQIQNGYEIEIYCDCYSYTGVPHLIFSITSIFERLDLDIRTINIEIEINEENNKFNINSIFFLQENENNNNNILINKRNIIESQIAKIFENGNIAASIKTKEIEMGKKDNINSDNSLHIDTYTSSLTLTQASPSVTSTGGLQSLAAITESIVTITPKRESTLPPSIEKGETIFNLIGLLENGDDNNKKTTSICQQIQKIEEISEDSNPETGESQSSSTIFDILNSQL